MKKILIFAFVIVCMVSLCACSRKKDNTILIAGMSEGNNYLSSVKEDIDLSYRFEKKNAKKDFECEINNEKIVGSYSNSLVSPFYHCDADIYTATIVDGKEIEFRVNRSTNKVVGYTIAYRNGYTTTQQKKSYEECLQIAKSVLSEYDGEEDYVQVFSETHSKPLHVYECGDVFSYYFRKVFYGKQTSILVHIDVNTDGVVVLVNAIEANEFSKNDAANFEKYNQNDELIIDELKKRITSSSKEYENDNFNFEIQNVYYCRLKNGNIYTIYDILIRSQISEDYDYVRVLKKIDF